MLDKVTIFIFFHYNIIIYSNTTGRLSQERTMLLWILCKQKCLNLMCAFLT